MAEKLKKVLKILFNIFLYSQALIGLFITFLVISMLFIAKNFIKENIPGKIDFSSKDTVYFDFDDGITENIPEISLINFEVNKSLNILDFIKGLDLASKDPKIKQFYARISNGSFNLSQAEEIRKAVINFRKSGKKAYIYLSGDFTNSTLEYYLSTSFDEIWTSPLSDFNLMGLSIESPFLKGTLDKIGVEPQIYSFYEYKSGASFLTEKEFNKQSRENLNSIADNLFNNITETISKSRDIKQEDVLRLIDTAPFSNNKAFDKKLVDKLIYESEAENLIDLKNKSIPLSYFAFKYKDLNEGKGEPNAAFLQLSGAIYSGESISGVGIDEGVIGSKSVTEILKEIEGKNGIKSVILRIDSPGGVYEPSSEIRNGLLKLKEKGKKVIVSMSGVCASGCYYITTGADYILAGENSITGSIGVFGGKVNLSGMWEKLGVNWENIKRGDNAGIFSLNRSFSDSEKQAFMKSLNNVYDDFISKVAQSRSIENIDEVARGRVFSGSEAFELNLIDELGGITESLKKASEYADTENLIIDFYPKPKTFKEKIEELIQGKELEMMVSKQMPLSFSKIKHILNQNEMELPYFRINH